MTGTQAAAAADVLVRRLPRVTDPAALVPLLRRPGEPFAFLDPSAAGAGWDDAIVAPLLSPVRAIGRLAELPTGPGSPPWLVAATYDHGRDLAGVRSVRPAEPDVAPLLAAPLTAWVRIDRSTRRASVEGVSAAAVAEIERRLRHPVPFAPPSPVTGPLDARTSRAAYEDAVRAAQAAIRRGETYQVNLSLRLEAPMGGDPWPIYVRLRRINPSPYDAFVDLGPGAPTLVSNSPELLVRVRGDEAATRPIAGTRPRGDTPAADAALEAELVSTAKERAEHVMLLDLARNDLGRVSRYGTVRVHGHALVERYSHVMHLVSDVRSRLRPHASPADAFEALFPAGTITGAPKRRTMEIIDELEPVQRGPYTGSLALLDQSGLHASILIRTLVVQAGRAMAQVGAGIVADSDPRREHDECLAKARALAGALGAGA